MDESLKWLLQLTKEEFYSIELCHECYLNYNDNSPTKLCVTPHLLVWAKQRSYPHWPAKLIRINQEQKDATVEVRYMGQPHFRAIVHPKNCLMFSKSNPSLGKIRQFETQLKEAETVRLFYPSLFSFFSFFNCIALLFLILFRFFRTNLTTVINKKECLMFSGTAKYVFFLGKITITIAVFLLQDIVLFDINI